MAFFVRVSLNDRVINPEGVCLWGSRALRVMCPVLSDNLNIWKFTLDVEEYSDKCSREVLQLILPSLFFVHHKILSFHICASLPLPLILASPFS